MDKVANQRGIVDRRALSERIEGVIGSHYQASQRPQIVAALKEAHAAGVAEIRGRLTATGLGSVVLAANAFLIDQLIRVIHDVAKRAYPVANPSKGEALAIAAVGGYGRQEQAPQSDIDILFVTPYKVPPSAEQIVEYVLYMLWDLGLKVGHATRSVDECIRLAKRDVTIQTNLLDARWLWGDQKVFAEFKKRYQAEVIEGGGPAFVEAKLAERDQRHERMGDARYVVEPNIKEGKGGLRDLQTLQWLVKFLYGADDPETLVAQKVFTEQDATRFAKAREFLWTVRCHLHYHTGRPEERLTFDVQKAIAAAMGYADRPGVSGVERFMKHYFLIAKDVGDLTRVLCAVLEDRHQKRTLLSRLPGLPRRRSQPLDGFVVDDRGRLNIEHEATFAEAPIKLLSLFKVAHEHDLDVHPEALRLVTQNLSLIGRKLREDPGANKVFIDILSSKKDPENALRKMNESGVFGRFVPDFGRIVAQMQYDMYHTYTVDEHTIRAIGILSRLEAGKYIKEMPHATQAVADIKSRRALYVALFMHDIAKGRGGDHSEIGGQLALELCPRFGLDAEETETVSWLVLQHLLMSDTAFKRDIDDQRTVQAFVNQVQSVERLRLLLVLTVCDIRAVGPAIWNNWKAGLLRGLYLRAMQILSGDQVIEHRAHRIERAKQELRAALAHWNGDEREAHIATGYPAYWLSYDTKTHIRHAEIVRKAKQENLALHVETHHDPVNRFTELTVYTPDHGGLFSEIAGAVALAGANIIDAKIVTFADGMALDTLSVVDPTGLEFADESRLMRLKQKIEDVLRGRIRLAREFEKASKQGLFKKSSPFTIPPRVLIDSNGSETDTIVEVNCHDRLGLLYDITSTLTALGLKISSAHVATYGERAVDSFYVKDLFGMKLERETKLKQVRTRLLEVLVQREEELAPAKPPADKKPPASAAAE
jgi:[protein-PII] uridylyltransferase